MSDINAEAAKLETALEDTLFKIMLDFNAPQATRDAADRILTQRLNEQLKAAVTNFQVGSMRLLDLVGQLTKAVEGLAGKSSAATAGLPDLLARAAELQRLVHDSEGMRTTFTSSQEADEPHPDEKMLPPLPTPTEEAEKKKAEEERKATSVNTVGPILHAPVPIDSSDYDVLADEYMQFFAGAGFKSVQAERLIGELAQRWLQFKPRYESVGQSLGIPWWFIAGIHMMESSFNFSTHLHNGDPLSGKTFRVPAGRPTAGKPPYDWETSAKDALVFEKLDKQTDWSLPRALYRWEAYNGFGYRSRHVPSAYLWSMSTIYRAGKFVADGVFDPNKASEQCGAATMLKFMHQQGHVALTLDRVGEPEKVTPELAAAVEAAKAADRPTVDTTLPANNDFTTFIMAKLPTLTHFKPSELLMMGSGGQNKPPPPELWPNVVDLAKVLDELRTKLGHPIVLTSVYRNEEHNAAVGGVKGSQHSRFCAADFQAKSGSPRDWAAILQRMRAEKFFLGGIGVYSSFVHVDTRGWNADWTG
jgi:lysozyme family protein/uncharacterized protein YcbK (DUF882 family)